MFKNKRWRLGTVRKCENLIFNFCPHFRRGNPDLSEFPGFKKRRKITLSSNDPEPSFRARVCYVNSLGPFTKENIYLAAVLLAFFSLTSPMARSTLIDVFTLNNVIGRLDTRVHLLFRVPSGPKCMRRLTEGGVR